MADKLFRWWPVVLAVLSIAIAWGALGVKVSQNCIDIADNRDNITDIREDISDCERLIPQIQTDIAWIKVILLEIKAELN